MVQFIKSSHFNDCYWIKRLHPRFNAQSRSVGTRQQPLKCMTDSLCNRPILMASHHYFIVRSSPVTVFASLFSAYNNNKIILMCMQ